MFRAMSLMVQAPVRSPVVVVPAVRVFVDCAQYHLSRGYNSESVARLYVPYPSRQTLICPRMAQPVPGGLADRTVCDGERPGEFHSGRYVTATVAPPPLITALAGFPEPVNPVSPPTL
jgi:hypothetical protein